MTFRVLALITFAAGVAALGSALSLLGEAPGGSPESAHLRRMKERTQPPSYVQPMTLADFLALPHGLPLGRRAELEERGVSIEGWNQRIMAAGDGDLHLEITPAPRRPDDRDTAYVTAEITPRWRTGHPAWSHDRLVEVFRPNTGGATRWDSGPRRVRVSGWLLYDYQYDATPSAWTLAHGSTRASGWEIHPVTKIEVWDASRDDWAEVAR